MYTFIRGCLRHFFCRAHTPLHPSVTSSRPDRLLSFIRTRPWFDSDITQSAFPFTASNTLCLLTHVLTPSFQSVAIIRFCCVIIRFCHAIIRFCRAIMIYMRHKKHIVTHLRSYDRSIFTTGRNVYISVRFALPSGQHSTYELN